MKINVQTFVDQILGDQFKTKTEQTTVAKIEKETTIKTGLDYISQITSGNELAQFEWSVKMPDGDDASVRLETSVINLPLQDTKTITKILELDQEREVNVYLVCETPDLNRSGLRIDLCASVTALIDDQASVTKLAQEWIKTQLVTIQTNRDEKKAEKK